MYFSIDFKNNSSPGLTAENLNHMQNILEELVHEVEYQKRNTTTPFMIRINPPLQEVKDKEIFYMTDDRVADLLDMDEMTFLTFIPDPNGRFGFKFAGVANRFTTGTKEEVIRMMQEGIEEPDDGGDTPGGGGDSGGETPEEPIIYIITYATNGGSLIPQQQVKAGSSIFPADETTRTDYNFIGWFLEEGFATPVIFPYKPTANTTFYAKWKSTLPPFVISFSVDGGEAVNNIEVERETSVSELPTTTKDGYNFVGWYLDENFENEVSLPFTPTADTTLYAKYEKIIVYYTVNFGTLGGSPVEPIVVEAGYSIDSPTSTRDGFTFEGWYSDVGLTNKITFPYTPTGNITLYANWEEIIYYTLTFITDGSPVYDCHVQAGLSIACPYSEKEGYSFKGWYLEPELINKVEFPLFPTSDMTLYVKWGEVYTVTFISNGGSSVDSVTVEPNVSIVLPKPTRTDYNFAGWYYDDGSFNNKVELPFIVTSNTTLYAKWDAIIYYTITYVSNGGTNFASVVLEKDSFVSLPEPTRENYMFRGWYSDVELNNIVVSPITLSSDMTLYAKWEPLTTFNSLSNIKIKYIRDEQWGNNGYWGDYFGDEGRWVEIEAYREGVNVALGCPIARSWDGRTYYDTVVTNGSFTETYTTWTGWKPRSVTVILNEAMNLDSIKIYRVTSDHPADADARFNNRVLVSEDEVNWYTLYDSSIEGAYTEETTGREFDTYYAYDITLQTNGGTALSNITVGMGESMDFPVSKKSGYFIEGWYSDVGLTNKITFPYTPTANITLYANWQEVKHGYLSALNLRYFKWCMGLNSENKNVNERAPHFIEFEAYLYGVKNIALNKPVMTCWENEYKLDQAVVNGSNDGLAEYFYNTTYNNVINYRKDFQSMGITIDLENGGYINNVTLIGPYDISWVTYNDARLYVSEDGITWYNAYDGSIDGRASEITNYDKSGLNLALDEISIDSREKYTIQDLKNINVRYIKETQHGSNYNEVANYCQIMAYIGTNNVALNKSYSVDGGDYQTGRITNGDYSENSYYEVYNGNASVIVDLGQAYNLDYIKSISWTENGNRTAYKDIEVSEDGITWYNVYETERDGILFGTAGNDKVFNEVKY